MAIEDTVNMACFRRHQTLLPIESRQLIRRLTPAIRARSLATVAPSTTYDAAIIGAGPGGLTAAGNLLDQGLNVCIIDPNFTAGRIHEKYREVPSNTKVKMFAQWATATEAFRRVLEAAPEANPYTKMLTFDQDKGCVLGDAINVAQMLSTGIRRDKRVDSIKSSVSQVHHHAGEWVFPEHGIAAHKVVLAQGSHPRGRPPVLKGDKLNRLRPIDLDTCLKPSKLRSIVSNGSTVGVIGSSHSAVLAMKNLYEIEGVRVVNCYRSPLLYAEYKDDWILYDNTGLKGIAANWAKEVLEHPSDHERLRRVDTKRYMEERDLNEHHMYQEVLAHCTHLVAAVGYTMNRRPEISTHGDNSGRQPIFDPHTGGFRQSRSSEEPVSGLYGVGIAYPETVTDRVGNVESAVGWFKFQKFLARVAPEWAKAS